MFLIVLNFLDWYRGFLVDKPNKLGIFPKCYVKIYNPQNLVHGFVYF